MAFLFRGWPAFIPLLCVALGFIATGCARRETRAAAGVREQVLHLGNGSEPKDLDPNTYQAAIEFTLLSALFEGLVNIANDGETILPGVAERWEISPNGLVYTFHLRRDARWSDGSPLTADDFLFSFRRVFTPSVAAPCADMGYAIANSKEMVMGKLASPEQLGVRAIDAHTFEVKLEYPAPYILFVLGGAPLLPVPSAVVERHGGATRGGTAWTRPGTLVGNGAFVLKAWQANAAISVTKNPHYWDRARVRLNEVRFYPLDNKSIEERAYRSGELHVTFSLPSNKLDTYARTTPPSLRITPLLESSYITFNTTRPPFNDVRLRRALALSIDREQLIPAVLKQSATPAHAITRPNTGGYTPARLKTYDPELARRLLAEAGFPGGNAAPPLELLSGGNTLLLAEALQDAWQKELGLTVKIRSQEDKSAISDKLSKNYQFALGGYFYGIQSAAFILSIARGDSASNDAGWKSEAFDRAMQKANHATTDPERNAAFDAMERLIHEEAPFAPLYHENKCALVSPSVRGWRDNALYVIDWRELWLETETRSAAR